ncbi:MAG TPA: enoyl-CoA hydratase-related protein [Alphaproteobacteria bacterium]|jgi:isohexenylglutaconyl-CoA hydratase|nr:enoyl-CoA hydratase-related protein [Alphaproteobacteria bacterium]
MALPDCQTIALEREGRILRLTLNRPEVRNAMNRQMVAELDAVITALADERDLSVVVLRGAGGHFCAGGDLRDMSSQNDEDDPDASLRSFNRKFGAMLMAIEALPQIIVAVVEGTVRGGGMGIVAVSDVALTTTDVTFAMPEVTLGLPPAQIAPFVTRRIGLTQARRLTLTGERVDAESARKMGFVHEVEPDTTALEARLEKLLAQIRRTAPGAVGGTKPLVLGTGVVPMPELLDRAAGVFADCVQSAEGREGLAAFAEKRKPAWAEE